MLLSDDERDLHDFEMVTFEEDNIRNSDDKY